MALFWVILSTQEAKFQIWYLSEFWLYCGENMLHSTKQLLEYTKKAKQNFL